MVISDFNIYFKEGQKKVKKSKKVDLKIQEPEKCNGLWLFGIRLSTFRNEKDGLLKVLEFCILTIVECTNRPDTHHPQSSLDCIRTITY